MIFVKLPTVLFVCLAIFFIGWAIMQRGIGYYTEPYYTEAVYKNLEDTFNRSQYRQKNPTALIPDETVFSYASGAYLHGVDPILINSEHTPLGKYFLALSILFFKNDRTIILVFALLTLVSIWILSRQVLGNMLAALIPVAIFAIEQLFLDQLRYVPLLDIIQLPFVFFTLAAFLSEQRRKTYWKTTLLLGLVMATKTVVPAILLVGVFILFFVFKRRLREALTFVIYLPLALIVFVLSYTRTFLSGYSIWEFLGFQKWIFLYQKSKLLYPFSVWRLIFLNQWQAWWGDFSILKADDWRITWPIGTTLTVGLVAFAFARKIRLNENSLLLLLWFGVYGTFLSIGVVSSRFLLSFLPITYILGTLFMVQVVKKKRFPRPAKRDSQ